ncbi:MAG: hypothetical protein JOZ90_06975 [Alphaproteobacteria bacterium]|nr:hypothetical protein [Alphaproteobacteria bacterium]MBV9370435.1 hypothetical protein [Alphaproteobacteria bacterium]MBV9900825.1 hypothetical protein [Alphaproteobacteria bacterium]
MAIINGTPGDDFLSGTPSADTINGLGGNDLVNAGAGDDSVDGGDGHDNLRGEDGNDSLSGGNGDDYLRGGLGNDLLDGGAGWDRAAFFTAPGGIAVDLRIQGVAQNTGMGMDTLVGIEHASGTEFADVITGDDGPNWLWGENGDDTISANGGDDLVEVGPGNVVADGGAGNDGFSVWANGAALAGVSVSLLLQGGAQATGIGTMTISGFENLSGSLGNDTLTGDGAANLLAGDQGNDHLSGGAGNDILYGDGRIIVDTHGTGLSGPIATYADVTAIDPALADGDDVLEGGDGDDLLNGGGGSDTASYATASGAVQVFLGAGGGSASGAAGEDTLISIENVTGSGYDDLIRGDANANVLDGGAGHDFMRGLGGNDVITGGTGDDYLDGGLGDDLLDGGAGWDRASYAVSATGGVTVNLALSGPQATGQGTDTLVGIEHVSGTIFNDVLTGDGGDNWIWGGSNGSGVTGNDTLSGGGGNDLVEVGPGTHLLSGGAGTDTLSLWGNDVDISAAGVTVSLALQGAPQDTEQGMMNLSGFENLSGSKYADVLTGDSGANLLAGDQGNDLLSGGDGDDVLYGDGRVTADTHDTGGSGPIVTYADVTLVDPTLVAGNDTLVGGKGNDTLNGGGGDDLLTGSQGEDRFVFGPASGHDHVTDFAKKDTIAILGVAGVDDFSDLTIVSVGGSAVISWGTGDTVTLDGYKASKLSAADFSFGPAPAAAHSAFAFEGHGADAHAAAQAMTWNP